MNDNNKIQAKSLDDNKIQANLPEGLYWVKHDGVINILDNLEISLTNVEQILGEVPTYDEWQAKLEENAQLKELLEWCRDELFEIYSNEVSHPEDVPIIKKLAEVLK